MDSSLRWNDGGGCDRINVNLASTLTLRINQCVTDTQPLNWFPMKSFLRVYKYQRFTRSFYLLKLKWRRMQPDDLWCHLRSIVIREHLHTTGHFERLWNRAHVINCAALLRMRRFQILSFYEKQGFELSSDVKKFSLPKSRYWKGINAICPSGGPNKAQQ
jgi:hypothetical protein